MNIARFVQRCNQRHNHDFNPRFEHLDRLRLDARVLQNVEHRNAAEELITASQRTWSMLEAEFLDAAVQHFERLFGPVSSADPCLPNQEDIAAFLMQEDVVQEIIALTARHAAGDDETFRLVAASVNECALLRFNRQHGFLHLPDDAPFSPEDYDEESVSLSK